MVNPNHCYMYNEIAKKKSKNSSGSFLWRRERAHGLINVPTRYTVYMLFVEKKLNINLNSKAIK